jgi:hypothetical protein
VARESLLFFILSKYDQLQLTQLQVPTNNTTANKIIKIPSSVLKKNVFSGTG